MNSSNTLPSFEPLDNRDGPALPLSSLAARSRADAIAKRALSKRSIWPRVAFIAGLSLAASGAMAAVIRYTNTTPPPAVQQRRPRVTHSRPISSSLPQDKANKPAPISETRSQPSPELSDLAARQKPVRASTDWLRLANGARSRKEFAKAEHLYLRIARLHPDTDDAAAANLAAAELRYRHLGRARDALPLYRKLLRSRPAGPLAEQAHVGMARTFAVLGDTVAEREAWLKLLHENPSSWFAAEARARINALKP